ncbi:MAG: serine/threonine protein kinase [Polyangiaceae bacterium]|nr:serine/threonine protein kinase [Polyangiaceae bacterium]
MAKEFGDGRFVVQKTLGVGGMGVVYEVHDVRMDRTIALKTLKNASATALYLFKNEFRALADLRHKNLIRIHELFCEKDPWFFTMELVNGVDLLTWLRDRPALAPPTNFEKTLDAATFGVTFPVTGTDATVTLAGARHFDPKAPAGLGVHHGSAVQNVNLRDVFLQLARALSVLHAHKKVHRDVKPSNVFVTKEGRVVLMDFGLVAESTTSGGDDVLAGTPLYMAPELMSGRSGPAADWYARVRRVGHWQEYTCSAFPFATPSERQGPCFVRPLL